MANIKAKLGGVLRTRDLESAALVARNLMTSANRTSHRMRKHDLGPARLN